MTATAALLLVALGGLALTVVSQGDDVDLAFWQPLLSQLYVTGASTSTP